MLSRGHLKVAVSGIKACIDWNPSLHLLRAKQPVWTESRSHVFQQVNHGVSWHAEVTTLALVLLFILVLVVPFYLTVFLLSKKTPYLFESIFWRELPDQSCPDLPSHHKISASVRPKCNLRSCHQWAIIWLVRKPKKFPPSCLRISNSCFLTLGKTPMSSPIFFPNVLAPKRVICRWKPWSDRGANHHLNVLCVTDGIYLIWPPAEPQPGCSKSSALCMGSLRRFSTDHYQLPS